MADEIEIGSKAIKQIQDLRAELIKLSQDVQAVNKNSISITTPGGLSKVSADNSKNIAELEALKLKYAELELQIKKLTYARQNNNKQSAQEAVNQRILNANAINEAKATSSLVGAYDKLNLAHQRAFKSAQNIGAQYGITSKEFIKASEKANLLDKELKELDSTLGRNNRYVGDYGRGYNALGNSINQLTREAPAFANSINTGFMALSNNFPALFDAINGIRQQNAALVAEGKPTTSLFKQLVSGLFSWQTLLSVGVTLLTLYGGKLVDWISALSKGSEGIKSLKENQTALNESIAEGNKDAAKEISQLDILYRTSTNVALSTEQRQKAVNKLQKEYPSYFANIQDEIILNGKAKDSYILLREAIFDSARAKAVQSELENRASERLEKELEIRERIGETEAKLAKQRASPKAFLGGEDNAEIFSAEEVTANLQKNLNKRKKELEDFRKRSLQEDDLLLKAKEKFEKGSAVLEADRIKITEPKVKKEIESKREKIEALNLEGVAIGTTIDQINKYIDALETEIILNSGNETATKGLKDALEQVLEVRRELLGIDNISASTDFKEQVQSDTEAVKKLTQEQQAYLRSFVDEFASNSGFQGTLKLFDGEDSLFSRLKDGMAFTKESWKADTVEIMEAAQEMYNFISDASQQNFDKERERAQNQYDVAIKYAGDNKAAQEKLAEDLEKQKKDIANREAKAKQKQAIFNIAIDTAQAIMALWAKPGFPAAVPLAIAVGALGALQIGMVASQKIPQYYMGGTHDGGLMMVNDGGGSNYKETIVTPDGKIMQPTGRNVIMDAPKGTEIFTQDQWNNTLQEMLQGKGISMSATVNNGNGLNAQQIDAIMGKHFSKIALNNVSFDENGMRTWSERNSNKTISTANRVSRRGINV